MRFDIYFMWHNLYTRSVTCIQQNSITCLPLSFTVLSFCELGPKLLEADDVEYLLSEAFSQDPLEAYFSRQRHRGGACDNPGVQQFYYNTASLVQQKEVYRDLKTMNVQASDQQLNVTSAPLPKRKRH